VPWFWQEEYRTPPRADFDLNFRRGRRVPALPTAWTCEQMQWRANKIAEYGAGFEWLFDQEYPATPALAFRARRASRSSPDQGDGGGQQPLPR
jgi:hypothetical protein